MQRRSRLVWAKGSGAGVAAIGGAEWLRCARIFEKRAGGGGKGGRDQQAADVSGGIQGNATMTEKSVCIGGLWSGSGLVERESESEGWEVVVVVVGVVGVVGNR